jgi:hypothetical protein
VANLPTDEQEGGGTFRPPTAFVAGSHGVNGNITGDCYRVGTKRKLVNGISQLCRKPKQK